MHAAAALLFMGAMSCAEFTYAGTDDSDVRVVPTFESAGLYWSAPGARGDCRVRFRKAGETEWRRGLDLWYDERSNECRGSLVQLQAATAYEAQLASGRGEVRSVAFRTWSERLPIARTVRVKSGRDTLHIREGGTAEGYVVYDGGGATLDADNKAQFNILIEASHVVVRGFVLRGAQQDAIRIAGDAVDVVIEDNDISGWGRPREGGWGADMDSGIRAVCRSCPQVERVVIQRNRIHDPRYSANSWSDGHPEGPQAIAFSWCGGRHVIRHNEMYNTGDKRFNDVMGGEDNFSRNGFPDSDTDIYGNVVADGWDDGIEAEGGNRNVRIWGNYIDRTATGVATTVTSVGPLYIFRNIYNRNRFKGKVAPDDDERQAFVKAGSDAALGDGRRYIFHNTMLQAVSESARQPLGAAAGIGGTGAKQPINNTVSRNNIYDLWRPRGVAYDVGRDDDFGYDLFSGETGGLRYVRPMVGKPVYAAGHGAVSGANGLYQLSRMSPGYDAGVRIPNFNDDFLGKAPDVGAHEAGTPPMKFGIAASRGSVIRGGPDQFVLSPSPAPRG